MATGAQPAVLPPACLRHKQYEIFGHLCHSFEGEGKRRSIRVVLEKRAGTSEGVLWGRTVGSYKEDFLGALSVEV